MKIVAAFQIVQEECFNGHVGFDLMDPEAAEKTARRFRVKKEAQVSELYELIGEHYVRYSVAAISFIANAVFFFQKLKPLSQFRLWAFQVRSNRTYRPTELPLLDRHHGSKPVKVRSI